jgi:hypothetical protein
MRKPNFVAIFTLALEWLQRFAHQQFVGERTVDLGRVEEGHATFHRGADQADGLLVISGRPVNRGEAHAAQSEGGHFEVTLPEFSLLHAHRSLIEVHKLPGAIPTCNGRGPAGTA